MAVGTGPKLPIFPDCSARAPALFRSWKLAALLLLVCVVPFRSKAQDSQQSAKAPEPARAFSQLEAWVKSRGGTLGAVVLDLNTQKQWVAVNAERALNPASNQKLLTAAVALDVLGPAYRYRTSIYGRVTGDKVRELTLTGHGDPSLGLEDLWRLGRALAAQGVRRVEGDLSVDQSRFDDAFEPPAYAQQPEEWASFRAPVSALSVNQNTVTLNILAGEPGQAARHWFEPPGVVSGSGSVETRAAGSGQNVLWKLEAAPGGVRSTLNGHVSAGQPRVRFVRRVADPRLLPGKAFASLLADLGVELTGSVKLGKRQAEQRLAYVTSPPLGELLHQLGKHSDNFYAETIFKSLSPEAHRIPASSEAAAARVQAWLSELGLASDQTKILNGSGLFDANRLSAATLAQLLSKVYLDPALGPDFVAQLAIGGVDGTLHSRFRDKKARGRIRAKTGTLRKVDALGGYVLSSSGRLPLVFVVLVNGIDSQHGLVRARIDRAVRVLAESS